MTHSVHTSALRSGLHPVAQAAAVLLLSAACHAAQAAVVYLPYCVTCTVDSTPPAGDEWVIQGNAVSFGTDNLRSEGLFTNNARTLTSGLHLELAGGFNNNTRLNNTGALVITGDPGFSNKGLFTNAGETTLVTTLGNAGRLINNGSFVNFGGHFTNQAGGSLTNNGTFSFRGGKLTNVAGAVINNYGEISNLTGATLQNQGTLNNRAGTVSIANIVNNGQIVNSSGATLKVGPALLNESGARLVNRGTLTVGPDARLTLRQGSDYDFRTGTLNITTKGKLQLERDFTIGDSKGGTVHLGAQGTITNKATLKIQGTQTTQGDFVNTGGTIVNAGTWTHQGALSGGELVNRGTFVAEGSVQGTGFTQTAGKTVVKGEVSLGQADIAKGTVEVQEGAFLSAQDLTLKGGLLADGATLGAGNLSVTSTGWLALGDSTLTVTGDFLDGSLANVTKWKTQEASLVFSGEGLHTFGVGLASHSWGSLTLDAAGSYAFANGSSLTVGEFLIADGDLSLLGAVSGDTVIYYDATLAGNAYLNGGTYSFGQGLGKLTASAESLAFAVPAMGAAAVGVVPEAAEWMMAIAGLSVLGLFRRRLGARA